MNFVVVRNCSIFTSMKIYPAICNYSLFLKMGGKFEFTRDVPSPLGSEPIDLEKRRKSLESKRRRRKDEVEDAVELERLHGKNEGRVFSKQIIAEVVKETR